MVEIEIDGKTLQAEPGSMIIEVADKVGIAIPRFCYHKKLSIAANCRMCLVEVEKAPKPLPACATPVTAGMKVYTASAKAKEAQRSVMEFLLINHPLDCPICDQGGECELQDVSLNYGAGISRFTEGKRSVKDDDLGSLIETEMTRCIQCTRCVRFGQEVAGFRELGATGRGENMQITTYIKHGMESELSGNIIDLCPVGALTSKPFRFTARAWELQQTPAVAPHDCVGSNFYLHTLRQKIMRAAPRENETLNETWLSDRDRFSYLGLDSADRLQTPLLKINGQWQETDWGTAFAFVTEQVQKIKQQHGAEQIAALASPSSTIEEFYLLQKVMRELGSSNIDHRLHQTDVSDQQAAPLFPTLAVKVEEIEQQDIILLVGANIAREQPIAAHRVRKATLRGAQVLSVNAIDYAFNFPQQASIIVAPLELPKVLAGIVKTLSEQAAHKLSAPMAELLRAVEPTVAEQALAQKLTAENKKTIILGAVAQNHPQASLIRALTQTIAQLTNATWGVLTEGANSAGAWLAGAIPHRLPAGIAAEKSGLAAYEALQAHLKAYLLLNIEPELDCTDASLTAAALEQAEFVLALSPFKAENLLRHADVILPIAAFGETAGTFVNVEGRWQNFSAAIEPRDAARPAWKVLRVLANQLALPGFDYISAEQVRDEIQEIIAAGSNVINFSPKVENNLAAWEFQASASNPQEINRITEWPLYSIDSIVRRAGALQESASNDPIAVCLNAKLAERLKLHEGMIVTVRQKTGHAKLPVTISARIPDECVLIHAGQNETAALGAAFGAVEIHVE